MQELTRVRQQHRALQDSMALDAARATDREADLRAALNSATADGLKRPPAPPVRGGVRPLVGVRPL